MSDTLLLRAAIRLVERFVPDHESLAGDLVEEHGRGRSLTWVWSQTIWAVATAWWPSAPMEIRPLRLLDTQPADAFARANQLLRRPVTVNLGLSPAGHTGGLGLALLALLLLSTAPVMWWFLLAAMAGGLVLGLVLIRRGGVTHTPEVIVHLH